MASIHKIKNREGVLYVRMYEGWRENGVHKTAVVKNFGRLDKLEENGHPDYETLREMAKNDEIEYVSRKPQISKRVTEEIDINEDITSRQSLQYGHLFIEGILNTLAIDKTVSEYQKTTKFRTNLTKVLHFLVQMRIINPGSKLTNCVDQEKLLNSPNFTYNEIDRSLDHLHTLKEQIQLQVHRSISNTIGRTATLVFYDVTNYYFETDYNDVDILDENENVIENGFRKKGPSKEKRPNPIVQMGLFIDSNGIPISYKLFEGNFVDPKTLIPAIKQVKEQFGLERIITVADKAMYNKNNVVDTTQKGDGYLFSSRVRGTATKYIQDFALDKNDWEYNEGRTFAKKSKVFDKKLPDGKIVKEKVLVTWNEKFATRQKVRRDGALEYASTLTNSEKLRIVCKKGGGKYLQLEIFDKVSKTTIPYSPFASLDLEKAKADEEYDGMNVLVTSELNMSDDEMIENYGQLYKIEDCFKITKSGFSARPVYHWTKQHIEAHFLSCFIALTVMKIIHYKLDAKYSPKRIIAALKSAECKTRNNGYYDCEANEDFVSITKTFGIDWKKRNILAKDFAKLTKLSLV
jgi:transposase